MAAIITENLSGSSPAMCANEASQTFAIRNGFYLDFHAHAVEVSKAATTM
jgi:hypothetical protein